MHFTFMSVEPNTLRRLAPYYKYLLEVKWIFLFGVLAGVLYGVSSGLGIPLVTKFVLPILFRPEGAVEALRSSEALPFEISFLTPATEFLQSLYGRVLELPRDKFLVIVCACLPLTFGVRAIGGYCNHYLISKAGLHVLERIRVKIFQKLQELSLAYYNKNNSGEIITKLDGASEQLRRTLMGTINDLIIQPVTLISSIGVIIFMALTSEGALPALIGILGIPLAVFPIRKFGKKIRKRSHSSQTKQERLSSFVLQNIQSPLEVRAYNLQERHAEFFQRENAEVLRQNLKVIKYTKFITPVIEVLAVLGLSASIYLGVKSGMTLETFTAIGTALYLAYEPVKRLGKLNALLEKGGVAIGRLESILHADEELPRESEPVAVPSPLVGEVTFRNISFSYTGEEQNLQGVDLTVGAGEVVALVGASGAGKSTFMGLIPRFYDPSEGEVLLDGIDLKQFKLSELRSQIALVPQMPTLFNLTVRENIAIGKEGATLEDVQQAARYAYAHDFIMKLPQGYDTLISEAGTSLSGGQRQRISIARAFLKEAPILLLDEATSALDNESQEKITMALDKLMVGKTVFMIAHRESSLSSATRRITFEAGRIRSDVMLSPLS